MVGIAIIDDGITQLTDNIIICKEYEYKDGKIITAEKSNEIKPNHGSVCAALIAERPTKFYSIKIIYNGNAASIESLKIAIEFASTLNISIIHISLGSLLWIDGYTLYEAVCTAISKGIIIVCSICEDGRRTFPGSLSNVIGVCYAKINEHDFVSCHPNIYNINVFADVKNASIKTNIGSYLIPPKSSYATALVTSKLCEWTENCASSSISLRGFYQYIDNTYCGEADSKNSSIEKLLLRKIDMLQSIRYGKISNNAKIVARVSELESAIEMVQMLNAAVLFSRDISQNSCLGVDDIIAELNPKVIAKLYCSEQLIELY